MVTLRDGKQATTSNAQRGKPRAPKRISKRAAAESQKAEKENKRPRVQVTEEEPQNQKHDSGSFDQSAGSASIKTNDQSKDTPVNSENDEARETRELNSQTLAPKITVKAEDIKQEDEGVPERSRDRIPTPGRNHAAMTDTRIRDNLTDPSLPKREADRIQQEIDERRRRKGPKAKALRNLELVRDSFLYPDEPFHSLYICHAKGPQGSATYDSQGFQLDYDKVAKWMKPSYMRRLAYKKYEEMLDKEAEDEMRMTEIFYEDGAAPTKEEAWNGVIDHWKLAVSKDLGIPWHHIDLKHFEDWSQKGFEKAKKGEYLEDFSAEEGNKVRDLLEGASLRK